MTSDPKLERTIDKILNQTEVENLSSLKKSFKESLEILSKSQTSLEQEYDRIIDEGKKEAMVLTIRAEKISLENLLRVTGKIVEGQEKVSMSHHTLSIEPGTILTIEKDWKKYHLERL